MTRVFSNRMGAGPRLNPYQPPQENVNQKQHMSADAPALRGNIILFWPALLYMMLFFLYAVSVWSFFHGDMGLGILGFLPCFIACAWVLPGVGLMQLVVGICKVCVKKDGGGHIASSLVVFGLTFLFYQYLFAGNIVTV